MATKLTASAVATYNNGTYYSDDSPVVGYRSAGVPRVIRYTFTTPSAGASSYSVMISGCSKLDGDCTSLKCYLTTSADSHAVATSAYSSDATITRRATTTGYGQYEFYSGTINKSLAGNTTYYLWVFAASETKPLSVFLPKTGYQYQTSLATITVNEGTGTNTSSGTTVSGSSVQFTDLVYTDTPHPYHMIVRVQESSSTSSTVTFSLKVILTSYTSGADYTYKYGNKLDIQINNSSLYYSNNITNGSYSLDVNYNEENTIYSGSFTLNRGTDGKASGMLYVNFCQTQLADFNAVVQETIVSTQAAGYVSTVPAAILGLTYNGGAQALVNAGSGTGTMYYSTTSATSGFSTSIPTATNAGTYTVWYYSAATTYYSKSSVGSVSVTMRQNTGYVTLAPSSGSTTYGTSKTTTITSNHGGTLSVSSNNTTVSSASRSGTTVTMTASNVGYATITVSCAATTNYTAATATYVLTVNKAEGHVSTAPTAKSLTYTGSAQALVNAGSGTGTMYYSTTSATSGFSTSIPTATNAGTYTVWYYAASSTNYNQSATGSVSVTMRPNTGYVTLASSSGSVTYGSSKTVTITSNHGGTLSVSSSNTTASSPTINGTTVTMPGSQAGSATITITVRCAATTNYTAASATYALRVDPATGYVTLSATSGSTNYGTNKTVTISTNHGGTLSVSSSNTTVSSPTINGTTVTMPGSQAGSATITVSCAATTNYTAATATYALTVNKISGSVSTAPTAKTLTYNGSTQSLVNAGSGTGTMYYSTTSATSGFSTSIPTATNAGTYTVWYYAASSTNYNQSSTGNVRVTIGQGTPTVTPPTAKTLTYSGSAQTLINAGSANSGGTMYYSTTSATSGFSASLPSGQNAGTYTVWYYAAATTNYKQSSTGSISVTIAKYTGSVSTAPTAKTLTYNGSTQSLVNAGSGTGTMYYSTTSATSGFSTSIPTATNAGTYTVWYYAASSTNYNQSSTGSVSVTISKATGSVTTNPTAISGLEYTGSAEVLINAGSGTGTMYYSTTSATSGFSTSLPTATNVGTYTVWYYAAASDNYNQSATGSVSINISKMSGYVTLSSSGNSEGIVGYGYTFTVSSHHGGSLSVISSNTNVAIVSIDGTTVTITPKANGSATITVTSSETSTYSEASASHTLSVSVSGVVHIAIGDITSFEGYQVFIDNGTSWDQYIPYIDNGTSWDPYG